MSYFRNEAGRNARVFVYRFSGRRSGWLARIALFGALIVAIPVALLAVVGLWALLAVTASVVATAALVGAPLLRRLRTTPPQRGQVLEGEARRIDVSD